MCTEVAASGCGLVTTAPVRPAQNVRDGGAPGQHERPQQSTDLRQCQRDTVGVGWLGDGDGHQRGQGDMARVMCRRQGVQPRTW